MKPTITVIGFLVMLLGLLLIGCTATDTLESGTSNCYRQISQAEAKQMMTDDHTLVVVDVRHQNENDAGHMLDWYAAADPDGASLAAESLMHKLEDLDTDDVFPEYEIEELSKYLKRLPPDYKPEEPPAPEPPVEMKPLFDCLPNSAEEDPPLLP